jgi:hypothetical protein
MEVNMKTIIFLIIVTTSTLIFPDSAKAKDISMNWSELRVFATETTFANQSEELNTLLEMDGIEKLDKVVGFGLEADAEVTKWFKVGTKFRGIFTGSNKKEAKLPATEYLSIQQYSAGLVGRISLINKQNLLLDIFAEAGLSNNTIEIKSTLGSAKWEKNSHFYQRAGASLAAGGPAIKFYIEGGYEMFKLDNLKHEGQFGQNTSEIDLSGSFVGIGLVFSGIPSWIKPRGLSTGK